MKYISSDRIKRRRDDFSLYKEHKKMRDFKNEDYKNKRE